MTKKRFLLIASLIVLLAGALYLTPALAAGPYQAENAVLGGGAVVNSNYSGYTGAGFVNFPANGGYVEFRNIDGGTGGSGTLKLRHALGSTGARTGRLTVNGVSQNITFNPTGSWTTWSIKEVVVTLTSGTTNTIRLASTGQDLANLDQLEVVPASLTPTATPVCEQPAPIYASTIVSPTSLQVNGTFNVSLTTTLKNPLVTLYAGNNVVATCSGSCQGSGLTIVNGSPTVQFVTVANPFIFTLKAIAAGTTNIYVTVQGEDTIYRFDPEAGACRPFPVPGVSGQSQTVPVTASTATVTPTPPACGAPIPVPSASLSVTPTTLTVGGTAQVTFSSQNVGMPQYTLFDGSNRIAVFKWGGGVDVYNESPTVHLVSGDARPAVVEAAAPGTADLKITANGEVIMSWGPGCTPVYTFRTVTSNSVPVTVSTGTPTPTPTHGPSGAGITTGQAKNVTATSAVLNSTSTITGDPQQVVVSYAYWETGNPAVVTTAQGQTYSGVGNFYDEILVTGLKASTQYTYHAIGRFMFEGTITAHDVTFTTLSGPSPTPTSGPVPCSPFTSNISVPFVFDGPGTFCWRTSSLGSFINTWNVDSLTINGIEFKNIWVGPGSYPPAINGFWYIGYRASLPWAHFEMK